MNLARLNRLRPLGIVVLLATSLVVGCGADDGDIPATGPHVMPTHEGARPDNEAKASAHLQYYGGPVISSARVWAVYWALGVEYRSEIESFYQSIPKSGYFDWLSEYDTPKEKIARGSYGGAVTSSRRSSAATVTDAQVRAELKKLIDGGKLSHDGLNDVYMVHFPPGVTIKAGNETSCSSFCGYHDVFTQNGRNAYYAVIPDMGGGCARGCGGGSAVDRTTTVASHELVEVITDGAAGLARGLGAPVAWYDPKNGEIGDICVGRDGQVAGFAVQAEWSNAANACVVTRGGGGASGDFSVEVTPASRAIARGKSATFTVRTKALSGKAARIDLSASALPAGVKAAFADTSPKAGASTTLTLTAAASAPTGKKKLRVDASSGAGSHSVTVSVDVTR